MNMITRYLKKSVMLVMAGWVVFSCSSKKYNADQYLSKADQDSILMCITIYDAKLPEGSDATLQTRFNEKYRPYYEKVKSISGMPYYYVAPDSTHYFLIMKRAISIHPNDKRTIGGRFKLDSNKKIYDYEEVFWMPRMDQDEALDKGKTLFTEMVEKGNVDRYLSDREYIEFPDAACYFDKSAATWKVKSHR
jgi:hypothetical protein